MANLTIGISDLKVCRPPDVLVTYALGSCVGICLLDSAAGASEPLPGTTIVLPGCPSDDLRAIYALYCIQVICLHHAMFRGVDPDKPEGLDAWIKL